MTRAFMPRCPYIADPDHSLQPAMRSELHVSQTAKGGRWSRSDPSHAPCWKSTVLHCGFANFVAFTHRGGVMWQVGRCVLAGVDVDEGLR